MVRHRQPPSQTWRTFLRNHVGQIAAADFFVVPTATYRPRLRVTERSARRWPASPLRALRGVAQPALICPAPLTLAGARRDHYSASFIDRLPGFVIGDSN